MTCARCGQLLDAETELLLKRCVACLLGMGPAYREKHDRDCGCYDCHLEAAEAAEDRADVVAKELDI